MRRVITAFAVATASTACTYTHFDPPPPTTPGGAPNYQQGVYSDHWTKYDNPSATQFEKDFKACRDAANAPDADGTVKQDRNWAFEQCMRKLGYSKG